jgi:mannose-6-phosphate isomerase-like protein (cupin superfamily)
MATPYTLKKLTDVKDSAAEFGIGHIQEARFAGGDLDAQDTGVALEHLKPNQRSPFGHVHEKAEEIYVVLSGSGRAKLDDEIVDLGPLDALRVSPTVTRAFEAGPDGLQLLAFGPRHKGDGETIQGWWSDESSR